MGWRSRDPARSSRSRFFGSARPRLRLHWAERQESPPLAQDSDARYSIARLSTKRAKAVTNGPFSRTFPNRSALELHCDSYISL